MARPCRARLRHVRPYEQAVAWGNRLRWDPLPVLQDYQAYTPGLDSLGEAKLRSDDAPERVLYSSSQSIDSRLASFDTPATARARRVASAREAGPGSSVTSLRSCGSR